MKGELAPVGAKRPAPQLTGHRPSALARVVAILAIAVAGCGGTPTSQTGSGDRPPTLRVGLIPNQAPDAVKAQYEPIRSYLSQRLHQPVELFVATDYNGVVEAMISNKLDLAYLGGVTYVQARTRSDIYPIVTEIDRLTQTTGYTSVIITRADGPIRSLAELKGKRFAFGDISSTSGSLYPRIMLEQAGFHFSSDPKQPPDGLRQIVYTGGHDATALAVVNGTVDAGGVEERILLRLEESGTVDRSRIRILQRSEPIAGYPWAVRARLDRALVDQITSIFLTLDDPDLLKLLRAAGYGRVADADYQYIREQARRFGLLT